MSYVSQPPIYDTRRHPNGEPPGYLDTSQREFPRDPQHGYILDERGYPLDDRGAGGGDYAPETRGYEGGRDFQHFPREYPGEYGGDLSYDSQPMMMIPPDELMHRDETYNRAMADPMSVHVRDPADRPYGAVDPMLSHSRDADDRMFSDREYAGAGQRADVSFVNCILYCSTDETWGLSTKNILQTS